MFLDPEVTLTDMSDKNYVDVFLFGHGGLLLLGLRLGPGLCRAHRGLVSALFFIIWSGGRGVGVVLPALDLPVARVDLKDSDASPLWGTRC